MDSRQTQKTKGETNMSDHIPDTYAEGLCGHHTDCPSYDPQWDCNELCMRVCTGEYAKNKEYCFEDAMTRDAMHHSMDKDD